VMASNGPPKVPLPLFLCFIAAGVEFACPFIGLDGLILFAQLLSSIVQYSE
jgi:hypothetical protein